MDQPQTLAAYFAGWAADRPARRAVAATVGALAEVAIELAELLGQGALAGPLGRSTGKQGEGDDQKEIDLLANNRIVDVLRGAPVAAVARKLATTSKLMERPVLRTHCAPAGSSTMNCTGSARSPESKVQSAREFSSLTTSAIDSPIARSSGR